MAGRQLQLALFSSQFSYLAARAATVRSRTLYLYKGSQNRVFLKKVKKSFGMGFSGISGAWRRAVSFKLDDLTLGGRFVARGVGNERLAKGTGEGLRQA